MPTLVHVDGFELQAFSITTFNAGGTAMYTTTTNQAVETTIKKHGAGALKVSPTGAAAGEVRRTVPAGHRTLTMSFYVYIASSLPASPLRLALIAGPATNSLGIWYDNTSGQFALRYGTAGSLTAFGPTVVGDTWYLIDWKLDISGSTYTHTASCNGGAGQTATIGSQTATDITAVGLGTNQTGGPAATIYYDDWAYGYDLADYPLGEHTTALLLPTSDGTHNAGTNVIEANGGADIDGSTTVAYTRVNEVPPENTDYVQQSAAGSGNYAEVVFDTPPAGTKWGATYWCALEGANVNASDLLFRVVDSGGSTLLDQGGASAVSGTTRRYSVGYVAGDPTGTKGRMGFATDVTPIPRALTFVAQVAYIPAATGETDFAGMIPL